MAKQFLNITKTALNKARIEIDGTIGGFDWDTRQYKNTGKDIRNQLKEIDNLEVDEIEVLITSLGGVVDDAVQIHDALKEHPAKITTIVQGFCASAATIIACAGDVRIISPNALYLIHKCRANMYGANEDALQEELETQRTVNEVMMNVYKGVLKKGESELQELFEANHGEGKWITAEEALAFGFATEIQDFASEPHASAMVASALNFMRDRMPHLAHNPQVEEINDVNNPSNNQNSIVMKKLLNFALLAALLEMSAETEFNEAQGLPLMEDKLQKLEDTLKVFEELKATTSAKEEELKGAQEALAVAEAKVAEKDSAIATLTAERDSFKAKYEAMPAAAPAANGRDQKEGDTFAEYVENDPYYKGVRESLGL